MMMSGFKREAPHRESDDNFGGAFRLGFGSGTDAI
jgi:hypothetical protein